MEGGLCSLYMFGGICAGEFRISSANWKSWCCQGCCGAPSQYDGARAPHILCYTASRQVLGYGKSLPIQFNITNIITNTITRSSRHTMAFVGQSSTGSRRPMGGGHLEINKECQQRDFRPFIAGIQSKSYNCTFIKEKGNPPVINSQGSASERLSLEGQFRSGELAGIRSYQT